MRRRTRLSWRRWDQYWWKMHWLDRNSDGIDTIWVATDVYYNELLSLWSICLTTVALMCTGEGDALSGSSKCSKVHWIVLQRQENQLCLWIHQRRNSPRDYHQNGKLKHFVMILCKCGQRMSISAIVLLLQDKEFPWRTRVGYAKDIAAGMVSFCGTYL